MLLFQRSNPPDIQFYAVFSLPAITESDYLSSAGLLVAMLYLNLEC